MTQTYKVKQTKNMKNKMSYKKKSVPKYIMNIYIVMIVLTSS